MLGQPGCRPRPVHAFAVHPISITNVVIHYSNSRYSPRRHGGGNILLMKSRILANSVSVLGATREPEVPFIGAARPSPLFDIAASQLVARDVSMIWMAWRLGGLTICKLRMLPLQIRERWPAKLPVEGTDAVDSSLSSPGSTEHRRLDIQEKAKV